MISLLLVYADHGGVFKLLKQLSFLPHLLQELRQSLEHGLVHVSLFEDFSGYGIWAWGLAT